MSNISRRDVLIMLLAAPSLITVNPEKMLAAQQAGEKFWVERTLDRIEGLVIYNGSEKVTFTVSEIWQALIEGKKIEKGSK